MRSVLPNILLLIFSLLVAFVLIESFVRTVQSSRDYAPSDCCSFTLKPNITFCYETKEFNNCFRTNSDGYLDEPFDCPSGNPTVAIFGDSFTEAKQVPQNSSYPALLRSMSGQCVHNFGVSAYGTGHELQTYRSHPIALRADTIVLQFQPQNDLTDNLRVTHWVDGTLLLSADPSYHQPGFFELRAPKYLRGRAGLLLARLGFLNGTGFNNFELKNYDVYAPQTQEWQDAWMRERVLLSSFKNETLSRGQRFIILIATAPEQTNPVYRDQLLTIYPQLRARNLVYDTPNMMMRSICNDLDIECIDLLAYNRTDTHFFYDGHWNEKGHALAATALNDAFTRDG